MALPLRYQAVDIMREMRNEMRNRIRQSNPLNHIFGRKGHMAMEELCSKLEELESATEDEDVGSIIRGEFLRFLDLYAEFATKSRQTVVQEMPTSLETLRTNIAKINGLAISGKIRDPNNEIAVKTNWIITELKKDIEWIEGIQRQKTI